MMRAWIIVMTQVMSPCDDWSHGALCELGYWSIVMTRAWSIVMRRPLNILMTCVMELCDDKGMEHCDDRGMEHYSDKFHRLL